MKSLYSAPLRVYLALGCLALAGLITATTLPISLFPNSSKPMVRVEVPYGNLTPEEFLHSYGEEIERIIGRVTVAGKKVELLESDYRDFQVVYKIEFPWETPPNEAMKEVQLVMNGFASRLSREMRDGLQVYQWSRNNGYLVLTFFSETRSLTDLHKILEENLLSQVSRTEDADRVIIFNPEQKEVVLEINPESMAAHRLFPRDIENAVRAALGGQAGGEIVMGPKTYSIQIPRSVKNLAALGRVVVPTPSGQRVHLNEVARVDLRASQSDAMSFKTSGASSVVLFATPKVGGNVKQMAEDIIAATEKTLPNLPKDIHYRKLVDPSEFINNAVQNVSKEVALGAFLAVLVLYLFIGSLKNVVTAAIEIPISMLMAFILMKWSGMNLNIISLGGLALSAGMNVDASVVVMENIFRYFERAKGKLSAEERLDLVVQAVREVRFPVIASTIASLVVFLPLAFTSALSNAILGDLAKTVVFSHGLSAIVALVLVPTVRLQLMAREKGQHHQPLLEKQIRWLESTYASLLERFLDSRMAQGLVYGGLALTLVGLIAFVAPTLPKEIIGLPDTDRLVFGIETKGNSNIRQMESIADEQEAKILEKFGKYIDFTFVEVRGPNSASISSRLHRKKDMTEVWKAMEKEFPNTPLVQYWVMPWNPAELPIPNPPHLRLVVRGGSLQERAETANQIRELLQEKQTFPRISTAPFPGYEHNVLFEPYPELWANLESKGVNFSQADLADLARVATQGRSIGDISLDEKNYNIRLSYPENRVRNVEDLGALPVSVENRLIPLKALGSIELKRTPPLIYRENGRDLFLVTGKMNKGEEQGIPAARLEADRLVKEWKVEREKQGKLGANSPSIIFEDPDKDRNDAIRQLGIAIALSILLIFLTMVIQFGSVVNSLLVLVSVPLGIIGVLLSLWIFGSTISLNSALGVILLNGLAVANSIILVDFLKRLVEEGIPPRQAAIESARQRLRPILITSLTTLLGMLPIALGLGEGAKILQPLGIAVGGGLWFSMGLTLFIVPALQVAYLERQQRRQKTAALAKTEFSRGETKIIAEFDRDMDKVTEARENAERENKLGEKSRRVRRGSREDQSRATDETPLH